MEFLVNDTDYIPLDSTWPGLRPGLYVKKFAETGAKVKGIDLSQRSIDYANRYIKAGHENIYFTRMNYLDIDYVESFDIATLIFYDFCALNSTEQNRLLDKIHRSLKSNGVFVFDVVTVNRESSESTSISIRESGFWSPDPYVLK